MIAQNKAIELELNKYLPVFKDYPFLTKKFHQSPADRADVEFIFEQVTKVPDPIKRIILNNAFKLNIRRERNLYILHTTKKVVSLLPEKLQYALTIDDGEVRVIAIDCADRCRRIALHHNVNRQIKSATKYNLEPLTAICQSNSTDIYQRLTKHAVSYGINAINITAQGITEIGAIKRMIDKNWWMRRLRKLFNQAYEQAAIELNLVHKYKQMYASDLTVKKENSKSYVMSKCLVR